MSINRINNHPELVEDGRIFASSWDDLEQPMPAKPLTVTIDGVPREAIPLTVKSCEFWDGWLAKPWIEPVVMPPNRWGMCDPSTWEAYREAKAIKARSDVAIQALRELQDDPKRAKGGIREEMREGGEELERLGSAFLKLCTRLIIKLRFVRKGRRRQDKSKQSSID